MGESPEGILVAAGGGSLGEHLIQHFLLLEVSNGHEILIDDAVLATTLLAAGRVVSIDPEGQLILFDLPSRFGGGRTWLTLCKVVLN
jgi:hypothetical protein